MTFLKRAICVMAFFCSIMLLSTVCFADDKISVVIDGEYLKTDVQPTILNDRTEHSKN